MAFSEMDFVNTDKRKVLAEFGISMTGVTSNYTAYCDFEPDLITMILHTPDYTQKHYINTWSSDIDSANQYSTSVASNGTPTSYKYAMPYTTNPNSGLIISVTDASTSSSGKWEVEFGYSTSVSGTKTLDFTIAGK